MVKKISLLLLSVVLLYINWTNWRQLIIGLGSLILYYIITSIAWGRVVAAVLPLDKIWSKIFGFLTVFYLSAMAVGIPVVVWKYDRLAVAGAMLAVGVVGLVLSSLLRHPERSSSGVEGSSGINNGIPRQARNDGVRFTKWHFILLGALSALFAFFVFHARTGVYILSPWDVLSSFTLILFFAIAFLVGLLVFSNRPVKIILAVLIAFSYLTHLYLPVIYQTGFGGDKWRHLGAERWLQDSNVYTPSIWGEVNRSMVNIGPLNLPEALVAGNKTSYAAQWASTIMLAESLGVDVFWVDLLLVFLLWSLFLPLILYQFGKIIFIHSSPYPSPQRGEGTQIGLLFAFLPTLFYTFQSEGAITLPVSFGHLFFFFVLLLWAYYAKEGKRGTLIMAWGLSLFFYWAYILNFFVLIGVGVLALAWRSIRPRLYPGGGRGVVLFGSLVLAAILAIPFLEIFQGLSSYLPGSASGRGLVDALADAMGRLAGYIGVIVPPDYIDQGNFLFNQSGKSLSRLPLFSYQLIPFLVSSLVWGIIIWGIYRIVIASRRRSNPAVNSGIATVASTLPRNDTKTLLFLAIIFLIALSSYFISWSFTEGVHILARRLNETIVFFMILFLGYGIYLWLQMSAPTFTKEGVRGWLRVSERKKILAVCFVLAFSATATFASGPKLQLVTADELQAAKYVWSELKNDAPPYCVIANTWPLLGLEAESGRRITAGGFPLYGEYAQPERVKIFEGLSKKPAMKWIDGAFRVTGAQTCYYMSEKRWMSDFVFEDTVKLLGEPVKIGTVYIWKIENRETAVALYK